MEPQDSEARRSRRISMLARIEEELGPFPPEHLRALRDVPRDRFVRASDVDRAELDTPLPLDETGKATISAPHAYLLSYRLLALAEGDHLLELGSGSGYGAALAAEIVGPRGSVVTVEIDPHLATRSRELLGDRPNVRALEGDALGAGRFFVDCNKVVCAFAVTELPPSWSKALAPGAVLVAPVGTGTQHLVRAVREPGGLTMTRHGAVRYVPNRSS